MKTNANGFFNTFPPTEQAAGNAGAVLNANGQMRNMSVGGSGVGGNILHGLGGINPLSAAAGHGLGGAAIPNTAYAAWIAQQVMLVKPCAAGGGAVGANGLGGQAMNAGSV